MGRIQSSIGLITGTDIAGTVDQLMAISGRPRDRLVRRTETLQQQQSAIGELTASVIGVQLAGKSLGNAALFRSTKSTSSDPDRLSVTGGTQATPGTHVIRTLQMAATHETRSLRRFAAADEPLGLSGTVTIRGGGGALDETLELADLNGGRGVEPGVIRITDRAGKSADIDLTDARTVDDVLDAINRADIGVRATTVGGAFRLADLTGGQAGNLQVRQLGTGETAADLGLWGVDIAADQVTGAELEMPQGATALRGVSLAELDGGSGIGPLSSLDFSLADGSQGSVDLSGANSTSEILDAINASGLAVIARLNDAGNGFQIRDVSGGGGTMSIDSADGTAAALGLEGSAEGNFLVGSSLKRQVVTDATLLSELNQGEGVQRGSFTIRDSGGQIGAINLQVENIQTVGDLIDRINGLGIGVNATLNDDGDGIAIVDTAGGGGTLEVTDSGQGTAAADLGIAGTATTQTVGGVPVSAIVGSQADRITIGADDTLEQIVAKLNENGRYADAEIEINPDGSFGLRLRSRRGGESGRFAINTDGLNLDVRTTAIGQDAMITVASDGGGERLLRSSDGVFELQEGVAADSRIDRDTLLTALNGGAGVTSGSFVITDRGGQVAAINLRAEQIRTVGELIDAINARDIGVTASLNDSADGLAIVDTSGGSGELKIEDTGSGSAAADLGIAGTGAEQVIGGETVVALAGPKPTAADAAANSLSLTLKGLSEDPITVTISENPDAAVNAAKTFVKQYNTLVEKLQSLTFFDETSQEVGLLFGSGETLRIETGYRRILSGDIRGAGTLRSLAQVGIRFQDDGKLELNENALKDALASAPGAVGAFFSTPETGLAARLDQLAERIAGTRGGLLLSRNQTLTERIERNRSRVESMERRLEAERERLLNQFIRMEEAIAKIQSDQQFLSNIRPIQIPEGRS